MLDLLTKIKEFFPEYFKANKLISEYPLKKMNYFAVNCEVSLRASSSVNHSSPQQAARYSGSRITDRKKFNIHITVINKSLNSAVSKLPIIRKNIALVTILLLSAWLNLTGLIPNTFFHQNEPGLLGPSDQIFKNVIIQGNFDPNIKPDPFKYASTLYYTQAFIRGTTLFLIYETHKLTGSNFGRPDKAFNVSFKEFVLDNGPHYFENPMLWAARFFTALLGVGCVFLIYLIALKLFRNRTIALFSAAALAVMPLHVRNSHYALADIPQVFFFLLSFWAAIHMNEKRTLKSYLLAGFLVGFSTSLKYFPLALLPFLIFHALTGWKNLLSKNFFSSLLAMFFGYLTGMPYLFVHFNKIAGFIPYALTWYGPDKLETQSSIFEKLLPKNIHAYHLKFLFMDGVLPQTFIASLTGIFIGLKYFRKAVLLTLIIPVINGIFIFFYVHQIYEHLSVPMLPFLAILIGLTAFFLVSFKKIKRIFLIAAVVLILYAPSFFSSAQASIACSTPITEFQSSEWIRQNIPLKSTFAFQPGARLPSELDINWIRSDLSSNFSLSELQEAEVKYLLIMKGYYGVYLSWSQDLFLPPRHIVDNQYVQLVINEYQNSATLVQDFIKPYMCLSEEIYIYKIPQKPSPASNLLKMFNFDDSKDVSFFQLINNREETSLNAVYNQGHSNPGSIRYLYSQGKFNPWRTDYSFLYATPVKSEFILIQKNKKYTLGAWIQSERKFQNKVGDFVLRIDFYKEIVDQPFQTFLSSRAKLHNDWQYLQVTSSIPSGTKFITIGFQALGAEKEASYLIDDIILNEQ